MQAPDLLVSDQRQRPGPRKLAKAASAVLECADQDFIAVFADFDV
jgi:hypothetical protein